MLKRLKTRCDKLTTVFESIPEHHGTEIYCGFTVTYRSHYKILTLTYPSSRRDDRLSSKLLKTVFEKKINDFESIHDSTGLENATQLR